MREKQFSPDSARRFSLLNICTALFLHIWLHKLHVLNINLSRKKWKSKKLFLHSDTELHCNDTWQQRQKVISSWSHNNICIPPCWVSEDALHWKRDQDKSRLLLRLTTLDPNVHQIQNLFYILAKRKRSRLALDNPYFSFLEQSTFYFLMK